MRRPVGLEVGGSNFRLRTESILSLRKERFQQIVWVIAPFALTTFAILKCLSSAEANLLHPLPLSGS